LRPWLQSRRPLRGLENHRVLKTRESFIPHSAFRIGYVAVPATAQLGRQAPAARSRRAHHSFCILHSSFCNGCVGGSIRAGGGRAPIASPCRRRLNARGERRRQARKAARVFILHSAFCILQSTFCIVVRRKGR
jgi:hypothetical protein